VSFSDDTPEKRDAVRDLQDYLQQHGLVLKESFQQKIMLFARAIYERGREAGRKEPKR
jgi:hypothetical protein